MEEIVSKKQKKIKEVQSFTSLVLENEQIMYRIARSRLHDISDIEDAIQDTLLIAFTHQGQLKDEKKWRAWILRILINQCNKIYRKRKVEPMSYELMETMNTHVGELIQEDEDNFIYREILDCLQPEERYIAILYYTVGYTTKEIAGILKKNENTIKTKLRRMKQKLREKVEGGAL
ncbi:MAG: RNA polymerase sigma factor [Clostridia bacterium]